MITWKTDEMVELLEPIGNVDTGERMGDFGTRSLLVDTPHTEGMFWVSGWNTQGVVDADEAEVSYISVTDGICSSGGLSSACQHMIQLYADIRKALSSLDVVLIDHYSQIL